MSVLWARHQKKWWGKWHLYLGIIAGLLLSVTGITGSILTFRLEIDAWLNPGIYEVQGTGKVLTYDEVVPIIAEQLKGQPVSYIKREPRLPGATYIVHNMKENKDYFFNPYTGQLIKERDFAKSFIGIVQELHTSLFIPGGIGNYVVGFATLIMLILTITGVRLWWPGAWKHVKAALLVKVSAGPKRINYDLHRSVGVFSAPFIVVLSVTGLAISFRMIVLPLSFIFSGQSPAMLSTVFRPASVVQVMDTVPKSLEEIIVTAHKELPALNIESLMLPMGKKGTYMVNGVLPGASSTGTRVLLWYDQYSGKLLSSTERDAPIVSHFYFTWVQALHFGTFGNIIPRILLVIAGLVPLFLCITGIVIWWPRYRKGQGKPLKPPKPVEPLGFGRQLKKGAAYACWILIATVVMSGLYGAVGGVVIPVIEFNVVLVSILCVGNFIVALLAGVGNVFASIFKKQSKRVTKYFAWSLSFMIISVLVAAGVLRLF